MNEYKNRTQSLAFTLVEMLAAIGIIVILAVILFPAIANAIGSAKGSSCMGNLRNLSAAVMNYVADNNGCYPPTMTIQNGGWYNYWPDVLAVYLPDQPGTTALGFPLKNKALFCPAREQHGTWGDYGANPEILRVLDMGSPINSIPLKASSVTNLRSRLLLCDSGTNGGKEGCFLINTSAFFTDPRRKDGVQGALYPPIHRNNFTNVLFADGHVEGLAFETLEENVKVLFGGAEDRP